jgi:hypothetical protein
MIFLNTSRAMPLEKHLILLIFDVKLGVKPNDAEKMMIGGKECSRVVATASLQVRKGNYCV